MIEINEIVKDVDRYCILLTGKPNYVGTNFWCEHTVNALKNNIESLGKPVDVISIIWKTDPCHGGSPYSRAAGFFKMPHHERHQVPDQFFRRQESYAYDKTLVKGKIKVKDTLETYLREQFDFADTFTTYYVDFYDILKRLKDEYNLDFPLSLGWQAQYYQLTEAYRLNPNMFDKYTTDSFILRLRYDNYFQNNHIKNIENFCPIVKYYASKLNEYKFKIHPTELEIAEQYPHILMAEPFNHNIWPIHFNNSIIRGKQFWIDDMMFGFDVNGIKTLVKNYENWTKKQTNGYNRNFVKNFSFENKYAPSDKINFEIREFCSHRHLTEFLFDYSYNMHFTMYTSSHILRNENMTLSDEYDDYRKRWYNYTDEQINDLNNIFWDNLNDNT